MEIVNDRLAVPAKLVSPNGNGYLLLAGEVGGWLGLLPTQRRRTRRSAARLAAVAHRLAADPAVEQVTVFRAAFRPPGEGREILDRRGLRHARYDVVVLVRADTPDAAVGLRQHPAMRELVTTLTGSAHRVHELAARNGARIAEVDADADHAFLFNYFYADDPDVLLGVWEYTAGWFQRKTSLPNSTLLQPLDGEGGEHGIINYASWPTWRTFLPSLLLRPGFRSFVLANFRANGVAAQPVIYRRVANVTG
ncbi:hypothetical protein B1813_00165 [Saccharomonospora piscinae]|uniref:Uncharacterized protein n=1 Tax=Saccharomonospora piscinae TaxID=687388 RepID=A0A1V9ABX2_SACPI|nr:hypothetical protein [Saccharomonospora piscinae]OQO94573.1 hypothetical protein B1813_00165 [Saccharomonospora piscinae]